MNVLYAVLRRFITIGLTSIIAFSIDNFPAWSKEALQSEPTTALWFPVIFLLIEAIQKIIREYLISKKLYVQKNK